jgi:hypothetical protein
MGETALLTYRQAILVEQDADFFAKGSARVISIASQRENQII